MVSADAMIALYQCFLVQLRYSRVVIKNSELLFGVNSSHLMNCFTVCEKLLFYQKKGSIKVFETVLRTVFEPKK